MSNIQNHRQLTIIQDNPVTLLLDNPEAFNEQCRQNPDLVPEFLTYIQDKSSFVVGFWWLSLPDDHAKTQQLEKHPMFAEKYDQKTCTNYSVICKKIPTHLRRCVVSNLNMRITEVITRGDSTVEDLEYFFNLAIETGVSSRTMEFIIKDRKNDKLVFSKMIPVLPDVLQGKPGDIQRYEELKNQIKVEAKEELEEVYKKGKSDGALEEKNKNNRVYLTGVRTVESPVRSIIVTSIVKF